MRKEAGNLLLWIVLGIVAVGLGAVIVWRYFAATDSFNDVQVANETSSSSNLGTVDVKEYGLKLTYDKSYGPVSYKITEDNLGNGAINKSIELTNQSLANKKDGCSDEGVPSYAQLGAISVQKQLDTGEFAPTNYIKKDNDYLVFNYLKMNMLKSDPCYDATLDQKSTAQKKALLNSFDAQATKNEAQSQ